MWRKLNREDLITGAPHFMELRGDVPFEWYVYEEYELRDLDERQYFRTADTDSLKQVYKPLEDTPHLFLEFARLAEQRDSVEALKEWISRRGLLGLQKRDRPEGDDIAGEAGLRNFRDDHWWTRNPWELELTEYMHEGGPSERLYSFHGEVITANSVLTKWEAVLSGEPERAEHELLGHFSTHDPLRERYIAFLELRASHLGLTYGEHLLHHAALLASIQVQDVLEAFTYPWLAFDYRHSYERLSGPPGPELVSGSWRPRNLLGAMYLQMYQLMISSGRLSRCRYCGRIISYAPSMAESKARKPRKDKEFCDSRCRQNYHYHTRIKPAHQR